MYLTPDQRNSACSLYQALNESQRRVKNGETDTGAIVQSAADSISEHPETMIDYIAICDPQTLDEVTVVKGPVLMALAVKVGQARLIDNMMLIP